MTDGIPAMTPERLGRLSREGREGGEVSDRRDVETARNTWPGGARDDSTDWERSVLTREELAGWIVQRIENEGHTWFHVKVIQTTDNQALFLHEVAHAIHGENRNPHDASWASIFTRLVSDHLRAIEEAQREDREEIERLKTIEREVEGYDELISRQARLLTGVVNAIKGEPSELVSWSHHDAPELAAALRRERDDTLRRLLAALRQRDEALTEAEDERWVNAELEGQIQAKGWSITEHDGGMSQSPSKTRRKPHAWIPSRSEADALQQDRDHLRAVLGRLVHEVYVAVRPNAYPDLEKALAEATPLVKKVGRP